MIEWAWAYFTYDRGARLITRMKSPSRDRRDDLAKDAEATYRPRRFHKQAFVLNHIDTLVYEPESHFVIPDARLHPHAWMKHGEIVQVAKQVRGASKHTDHVNGPR